MENLGVRFPWCELGGGPSMLDDGMSAPRVFSISVAIGMTGTDSKTAGCRMAWAVVDVTTDVFSVRAVGG